MIDNILLTYQTETKSPFKKTPVPPQKKKIGTISPFKTNQMLLTAFPKHRQVNSFANTFEDKQIHKSNKLLNSDTKTSLKRKKQSNGQSALARFDLGGIELGRNKGIKKKNLSFNKKSKEEVVNTRYKKIATPVPKVTCYDRHMKFNSAKTLTNLTQTMNVSNNVLTPSNNSFVRKKQENHPKRSMKEKINEILENSIIDQKFENEIKNDELILNKSSSSFDIFLKQNEQEIEMLNKETTKENFSSLKNDFEIFYTDDYVSSISEGMLQLELQLVIEKIFEIQAEYHKEYKAHLHNYKIYLELLNKNSRSFFLYLKKYNELMKLKERSKIKKIKHLIIESKKQNYSLIKGEINLLDKITESSNLPIFKSKKQINPKLFKNIFILICQRAKTKLTNNQRDFYHETLIQKGINENKSENLLTNTNTNASESVPFKKKSSSKMSITSKKKGKTVNQQFDKITKVLFTSDH